MILSSLYLKFRERKIFLEMKKVLDLGFGRGFLLNAVAKKRLDKGKAYGIDIF